MKIKESEIEESYSQYLRTIENTMPLGVHVGDPVENYSIPMRKEVFISRFEQDVEFARKWMTKKQI